MCRKKDKLGMDCCYQLPVFQANSKIIEGMADGIAGALMDLAQEYEQ